MVELIAHWFDSNINWIGQHITPMNWALIILKTNWRTLCFYKLLSDKTGLANTSLQWIWLLLQRQHFARINCTLIRQQSKLDWPIHPPIGLYTSNCQVLFHFIPYSGFHNCPKVLIAPNFHRSIQSWATEIDSRGRSLFVSAMCVLKFSSIKVHRNKFYYVLLKSFVSASSNVLSKRLETRQRACSTHWRSS